MPDDFRTSELIYDWNALDTPPKPRDIELSDETLRDGLQSPSIVDPPIEKKRQALHYIHALGIPNANIAMPTGPRTKAEAIELAREIAKHKLKIHPNCAARTVVADVQAIIDVSQAAGLPIEVSTFIGSSAIRKLAEGWNLEQMQRHVEQAVTLGAKHQLPVMFVTEDTSRAHPDTLRVLYRTAVVCGAYRITLADTVGHSTPRGVRNLVRFIREDVLAKYPKIRVDWHGHNDRGLALANSLAALEAGVDCVHGTILGIGERVGNTALDQLLVNLKLLGWLENDLSKLPEYCRLVAEDCGAPLPFNYPVFGRDAFRTSTGVHAAAVIKAKEKGDDFLANRIYSAVPAELFGRKQEIEIGPASGHHNVEHWLKEHKIAPHPALVQALLERAKHARTVLSEPQIIQIVKTHIQQEV
ncbi:LeuA family protein [Candidatus Acetothermia bacterium]|jgi:2-isopropylmalate synthase|nr:LeuA family protein [Candidatus Acetothermia bacterium]MCI2431961.1 LeuA family protein [Candidatus Acetothermia bacterium]MCI2436724.1 LeuA family protein [Candidatus Acetothermia bacterium]